MKKRNSKGNRPKGIPVPAPGIVFDFFQGGPNIYKLLGKKISELT